MIYTDLNEIPLQRFIDVFFGEYGALVMNGNHSQDELSEVANRMISDYMVIIGGRQVVSEVSKQNDMLNLSAKIECMLACKNLIKIDRFLEVAAILSIYGYRIQPDNVDQITNKVESILSNSLFRLNSNKENARVNKTKSPDRESFVKERVVLMQHYKMHINPMVFTAAEYAYMVKGLCEEIDRINKKVI